MEELYIEKGCSGTWRTAYRFYGKRNQLTGESYPDIRMILVSKGRDGSSCYQKGRKVTVQSFLQGSTIETTGAGDTFCACVLHYVLENGLRDYSEDEMRDMLTFANAGASIITTRRGALRVMPEREEILNLIKLR